MSNDKLILGIHDGHDCSAALLKGGEIVAACQEERFSGLKGDYGYPRESIHYCLRHAGVTGKDLDGVALSGASLNPVLSYLKRNANFSVSDWIKEQDSFWKPLKFEKRQVNYLDLYRDHPKFRFDKYYDFEGMLSGYMSAEEMGMFLNSRTKMIVQDLGVDKHKIHVLNHETNHKCYALFASHFRNEPVLVLTSEGVGDKYNATVSVYRDGRIETVANLLENHLGHIYQYVTLILGMKPAQHEYKVMGLAPYSNDYETNKAYNVFKKYLKVEGLEVKWDQRPADLYFTVRDELKECRFDGIAGGVQKFLEERLCDWVRNCVNHTGVRKVVFGGGVAQNIKANKSISELPEVDDLFVPPAAGDTSNSVGACYQLYYAMMPKTYEAHAYLKPLKHVYLGPSFTTQESAAVVRAELDDARWQVIENVTNAEIARRLARGEILGCMRGRMEFGLRALGNRSILADPSKSDTIDRINAKIKFRDFWMPFTPSMLAYRAKDYLKNPKHLRSPFMTLAFDSVPDARHAFPAGMHPADKTVRAQILDEEANPRYFDLIREFEKITGHGVILNTSFNLHGLPVVLGPKEAVYTLKNSGLDGLLLEDMLIVRKAA